MIYDPEQTDKNAMDRITYQKSAKQQSAYIQEYKNPDQIYNGNISTKTYTCT